LHKTGKAQIRLQGDDERVVLVPVVVLGLEERLCRHIDDENEDELAQ
jgi:hypothetical protein